jgi:hypothetical protein
MKPLRSCVSLPNASAAAIGQSASITHSVTPPLTGGKIMPVLFAIRSGNGRKFGTVHAVESATGRAGVYNDETGKVLVPDRDAVREALPYHWRKAFDRNGGSFWFDGTGKLTERGYNGASPFITLRNYRGVYLATVYAVPYNFDPNAKEA